MVDDIRARHIPCVHDENDYGYNAAVPTHCDTCGQLWGENGCDTATVLAALDESDAHLGRLLLMNDNRQQLIDAAIEREQQLLEEAHQQASHWFAESQKQTSVYEEARDAYRTALRLRIEQTERLQHAIDVYVEHTYAEKPYHEDGDGCWDVLEAAASRFS